VFQRLLVIGMVSTMGLASTNLVASSSSGSALENHADFSIPALSEISTDQPFSLVGLEADAGPVVARRNFDAERGGFVRAGDDVYLHMPVPLSTERPPMVGNIQLLEGDLYFADGEKLVEATFLADAIDGRESAINSLERQMGSPDFEVVLPGALGLVLGWKSAGEYLLCSFTDMSVFQISAFPDDPEDLMAGSQIVLYEGLAAYARRMDAGDSPQDSAEELLRIVRWVAMARSILEQ